MAKKRPPRPRKRGSWIVAVEELKPDVKVLTATPDEAEALAFAERYMTGKGGRRERKHLWHLPTKVGDNKKQVTVKFYPEEDD